MEDTSLSQEGREFILHDKKNAENACFAGLFYVVTQSPNTPVVHL